MRSLLARTPARTHRSLELERRATPLSNGSAVRRRGRSGLEDFFRSMAGSYMFGKCLHRDHTLSGAVRDACALSCHDPRAHRERISRPARAPAHPRAPAIWMTDRLSATTTSAQLWRVRRRPPLPRPPRPSPRPRAHKFDSRCSACALTLSMVHRLSPLEEFHTSCPACILLHIHMHASALPPFKHQRGW